METRRQHFQPKAGNRNQCPQCGKNMIINCVNQKNVFLKPNKNYFLNNFRNSAKRWILSKTCYIYTLLFHQYITFILKTNPGNK